MTISEGEQFAPENSEAYLPPPKPMADSSQPQAAGRTGLRISTGIALVLLAFALGLGSGYLIRGHFPAGQATEAAASIDSGQEAAQADDQVPADTASKAAATATNDTSTQAAVASQQESAANVVSLPTSYTLPTTFGDIGPQLLAAGAIDYERFIQLYQQAGQPLTEEQLQILTKGSDAPVTISRENAYFLLNFFWAFGLTNKNPILEEGAMMQYSQGEIGRFASTGGWTIGAKPATGLYSTVPIVTLTPEQQARLEEVATAVYRPCCNNPTAFPDCNHGMAMLGLLELMASQGASTDEMFEAAKYVNAFWFPQQALEQATFFKATQGLDFAAIDAREIVGPKFSSASGFRQLHQALAENGLLPQAPGGRNNCGV